MPDSTLRSLFFQHIAQTTPDPMGLHIVSGKDCFLYDAEGNQYIDFISGISVSSLGHSNPLIIHAVKKQLDSFNHVMVYGDFILSPQVRLAQKISEHLPSSISSVYFVSSGSEAIEGGMKLAKKFTGRTKIIACKNAYHGSSTQGAMSLLGDETFKQAFRPLIPDIHFIEFNNINTLSAIDEKTACVFVEPIQSETGYLCAHPEFLQVLSNKCKQYGALLIMDEIQSGMGRTGKMFGFEHYNLTPDIVCLAKALGAGFPLGAFAASSEMMKCLSVDPVLGHLTTFGGNPVACSAALASMDILEQNEFLSLVKKKEKTIRNSLQNLPHVNHISGKGLMLALHFDDENICQQVIRKCIENHIICDWFLFNGAAMRMAPPLIIDDKLLIETCETISKIVKNI